MRAQKYSCPVELAVTLLGGKWKVVVLARLKEKPQRYADLRASIPGLSDKVLTERLRELVAAGMVTRTKRGRRGAPSSYRLSKRGEQLRPALEALYRWGLAEGHALGASFSAPEPD